MYKNDADYDCEKLNMVSLKKIKVEWLGDGTGIPDFIIPTNVELDVFALNLNFFPTDTNRRNLFFWKPKNGVFVEFQQRSSHFKNTFITYWGKSNSLQEVVERISQHGSYYDLQDNLGFDYAALMCFAELEYN